MRCAGVSAEGLPVLADAESGAPLPLVPVPSAARRDASRVGSVCFGFGPSARACGFRGDSGFALRSVLRVSWARTRACWSAFGALVSGGRAEVDGVEPDPRLGPSAARRAELDVGESADIGITVFVFGWEQHGLDPVQPGQVGRTGVETLCGIGRVAQLTEGLLDDGR